MPGNTFQNLISTLCLAGPVSKKLASIHQGLFYATGYQPDMKNLFRSDEEDVEIPATTVATTQATTAGVLATQVPTLNKVSGPNALIPRSGNQYALSPWIWSATGRMLTGHT